MSNFGSQTFIKGTAFDAVNNIDFNYVIDVMSINGSGSKTYSDVDLSIFSIVSVCIVEVPGNADGDYTTSVSGSKVSWNARSSAKLIVTAVMK